MSGSCRRSNDGRPPARGGAGFSLLELLVVLALVGMLSAIVAPRLQNTYEAIAGSGERAEVYRQLERLPLIARATGNAIELPANTVIPSASIILPEGWTVRPLEPLRIEVSGVCRSTRVRIDGRGTSEEALLSLPDCRVRSAP
ncbi:prepilin-type N-terminal cleavage/methylation domain-containing protein [Thermomonas sp.]